MIDPNIKHVPAFLVSFVLQVRCFALFALLAFFSLPYIVPDIYASLACGIRSMKNALAGLSEIVEKTEAGVN